MTKILLIDNDSINNFVIQRLVKRSSFGVSIRVDICFDEREATNYIQNAFQQTEELLPDMILLDLAIVNVELFLSKFDEMSVSINKKIKLYLTSWSINPEEHIQISKYSCVTGLAPKPLYAEHLEQMLAELIGIAQ